jgi:ATP-dependent Clp protease ATP-binding subunit ClpA
MWFQYSDRARRLILDCDNQAKAMGAAEVLSNHLVLALLSGGDSLAQRILEQLEVDLEALRVAASKTPLLTINHSGPTSLSRAGKRILDLAFYEFERSKSSDIGTDHLLFALASSNEGSSSQLLTNAGVDAERVRELSRAYREEDPTNKRESILSRFDGPSNELLEMAVSIASDHKSARIEAEHILMALVTEPRDEVAAILEIVGLTCENLRERLQERRQPSEAEEGEEMAWGESGNLTIRVACLAEPSALIGPTILLSSCLAVLGKDDSWSKPGDPGESELREAVTRMSREKGER